MKETHTFLVPDYFPRFACKMGDCRAACCQGWPVSVSMENYFRLLGLDCRPELRQRLDCGLRPVDRPTQDEYARFNPRYDGDCPVRMADGRCALQAEMGEDVLPDICRLYPRGIRAGAGDGTGGYECSCASSCEGVIELLFSHPAPLDFIPHTMTIGIPPLPPRTAHFETLGHAWELRRFFIRLIQNRELPLPGRLVHLGANLHAAETALRDRDEAALARVLAGAVPVPAMPADQLTQAHLADGLRICEGLLELLDARSDSIRARGEAALAYFGRDAGALDRYLTAKADFEHRFPDWPVWFEHLLVNHMFFAQFPFQDRPESIGDEYVALCAVYALLRFLALGTRPADQTAFVDTAAALFRLIDHTSFDRYAAHLLKRVGCGTPEALADLISL